MSEFVTIEPRRLAVHHLELAVHHLLLGSEDGYHLLDAVRSAHLSLVAGLTEALTDSAGFGALTDRSAVGLARSLAACEAVFVEERTLSFLDLLKAATETRLPWSDGPLVLSDEEAAACKRLDADRHQIEHPKPTSWGVPRFYMAENVSTALSVLPRLMQAVWHHYDKADFERVECSLLRLRSLFDAPQAVEI